MAGESTAISLRTLLEPDGYIEQVTNGGISIPYTMDLVRRMVKQGGFQGQVSDTDCLAFVSLCLETGANPYMKEAWLVPMSGGKLQPIVAAQYKLGLAHKCVGYRGFTQGWITKDGVRHPSGPKCTAKQEEINGVWGIYKRGEEEDLYLETFMSEFIRTTKSGYGNWDVRPLTMLQKVNRDHGIRQKYPELLNGAYTENEVDSMRMSPMSAPTCDTPKRGDRKTVDNEADKIPFGNDESTEQSTVDADTLLAMCDGCRNAFADQIGITDEPAKHKLFTFFVSLVFMCPVDDITDEFYTFDVLMKINDVLSAGITDEIKAELGIE